MNKFVSCKLFVLFAIQMTGEYGSKASHFKVKYIVTKPASYEIYSYDQTPAQLELHIGVPWLSPPENAIIFLVWANYFLQIVLHKLTQVFESFKHYCSTIHSPEASFSTPVLPTSLPVLISKFHKPDFNLYSFDSSAFQEYGYWSARYDLAESKRQR